MRTIHNTLSVISLLVACAPIAWANLSINATFDSSITTDANATLIEEGINEAISRIEADIANPITVDITFKSMLTGLGQSDTYSYNLTYSQYLNDLKTKQILSANDTTAIASLPISSTNPVNGNTYVSINTPLYKALGYSSSGSDGTIGLNTSIMNLSRTGTQNASYYDLQAVAAHEIDEVLGIGGPGSILPSTNGPIGVLDLFRYDTNGARSFDPGSGTEAYFSIDGGTTQLVKFNQNSSGDYADWATGATPQVQDAFGSPGTQINVGTNELTALDVVGYNLSAVPEPSTCFLLGLGSLALVAAYRRRVL